MEKYYLEKPSLERKLDLKKYINEFINAKSIIHGLGGVNSIYNGSTYEEWLEENIKLENKEYAEEKGLVAGVTYLTIRESDNKIVGTINIRYTLNEYLRKIAGHIGYGIRPSERRKGLAKIQLYLALKEAYKVNLNKVMISCEETNIASEKTILALGGILERIEYDEPRDRYLKVHMLDVKESLEKNKDIYEKYVKDND